MIGLDYTFMTAPAVDGGITDDELRGAAGAFSSARQQTMARYAEGELGFFDLGNDRRLLDQSREIAARMSQRGITDVVQCGIGGSALGPIALRTALVASDWNSLGSTGRNGKPRLHVLDNVDPTTMAQLFARLDFRTTLFLVVSKSGGTAETMAQYLIVRGRLKEAGLTIADHIIMVTDPSHGALREIVRADNLLAAEIPPNVGGRYSVLTPVGVLPAALIGIDVENLLRGAGEMRGRCDVTELPKNPAAVFATLQWLAATKHGRVMNVLMPYSDPLRDMAAWFVQLWAESLGKIRPDGSHAGPTPIGARGTTDQHSQMQLFMEGPPDKTVTFVVVKDRGVDVPVPNGLTTAADLAYLGGHSLGELLDAEQRATAASLAKRGRLSMTITLDRVDAWHVGGLMMLLEVATAYAGAFFGVNAFDQPGVELAKRFTYALMGRPGFDDVKRDWDALPRSDPRYAV